MFYRRISGWSSFWRRSRSLAKSWRELFESWPSRRMIVLGMTAATEHIHTIILILAWLCVCAWVHLCKLGCGGTGLCVCLCVFVYPPMLHFHISVMQSWTSLCDNNAWSVFASNAGAWFDILMKSNLSSWSSLTSCDYEFASSWSSSAKLWLIKWDVCQNDTVSWWLALWTLPSKWNNFGQGRNKFSAASFASFGNRKRSTKPLRCSPACTSVTNGTDSLPFTSWPFFFFFFFLSL